MSSPQKEICCFCHLPKASHHCDVCGEPLCRGCTQSLAPDDFSLLDQRPENLSKIHYCPRCFDENVEPARVSYNELLERAKQVHFWPRTYRGQIPILKKGRDELIVTGGNDRGEVLLKLGFLAAKQGFNGLVHGELSSRKLRNHGYQKMEWTARAIPARVDEARLERDEFLEANWRTLHHR